MPNYPASVADYSVSRRDRLLLIAGPCVLENRQLTLSIAGELASIAASRPIQLVFKASFDKANRTSLDSFRGVGLDAGLAMLADVRAKFGIPVTTDIHEPPQAAQVAEVCQLIQIPAFLARQTDLLVAAAHSGAAVNVKKGQFMAPGDMAHVVAKLTSAGCQNVLLCERGTFFGYGRLVNDMRSIPVMQALGAPVVFDATHSVQHPSAADGRTGGDREMVEPLSRCAMALGCEGLFLETHPDPDSSPSDGPNMVPLGELPRMLDRLLAVRQAMSAID